MKAQHFFCLRIEPSIVIAWCSHWSKRLYCKRVAEGWKWTGIPLIIHFWGQPKKSELFAVDLHLQSNWGAMGSKQCCLFLYVQHIRTALHVPPNPSKMALLAVSTVSYALKPMRTNRLTWRVCLCVPTHSLSISPSLPPSPLRLHEQNSPR